MPIVQRKPKWWARFTNLIASCWEHHSPCESLNTSVSYDTEEKTWLVMAAPVFQEVLGGEADGKRMWPGFEFHTDHFVSAPEVFVMNFSTGSSCHDCGNKTPRLMFHGKFRGHRFYLEIMLTPPPKSPTVEILDTINQKIILKGDENDDGGADQGEDHQGHEGKEPREGHPPGLPGETPAD